MKNESEVSALIFFIYYVSQTSDQAWAGSHTHIHTPDSCVTCLYIMHPNTPY